jgi:hypothetical protein
MFAKVFEQIFDSSIAQDYTVRHTFIDLLILADSTGVVDMTPDAIARRTNVPQETVERCIAKLCQPDVKSRSPLEDGKRLVPVDSRRDWGWKIVNYGHYRKIRDQEARRSYFRDYQRKRRKKLKVVKDTMVDKVNRVESFPSPSVSKSVCTQEEAEKFCVSLGLPKSDGEAMVLHWQEKKWPKDWKLTIRKWKSFGYMPSQKNRNGARFSSAKLKAPVYPKLPEKREVTEAELAAQRKIVREASQKLKAELNL